MTIRFIASVSLLLFSVLFMPVTYPANIAEEGYVLMDLKTHKILAQKDSTNYFNPASSLKIFTATAALLTLGENYTYKTWITFNAKAIHQHALEGDVSLVFSGDPMLKKADIHKLLWALKAYGIRKINGNVLLVAKDFDDEPYPDGWPHDQLHICYSGPTHAINLENNCFLFYVYSTKNSHPIDIPPVVECSKIKPNEPCVINRAITCDDINRPLLLKNENNQYVISGCLSPNTRAQRMKIAIPNTTIYTQALIREQLKKIAITVQGNIKVSNKLPTTTAIQTHQSYPLKSLIRIMLKYSDDLIANTLFKTLGGSYYHAQGSWQRGINAEKAIFSKILGINKKELFIFDGSGESYYDAITPQQMIKLLVYIQKTPKLSPVIIPALPINGVDGTLVNRLKNYPGIIHAKTGTWRDVAALAGYVMKYNTQYVFSIFVNGMTPLERGLPDQADAWLLSVLPPANHSTMKKHK